MAKPKTKLEYLRRTKLLSQKEVAVQLDISQQRYSQIERDPERITLKDAKKIKEILNVQHIDDLLGEVV